MNRELFGKIHEIIRVEPSKFSMSSWERTGECGTTRCIAGWAIALTTGQTLKDPLHRPHQSVVDLASQFDVDANFVDVGAALLGLDFDDAAALFYATNEEGAEFVRLVATEGEGAAWDYFHEEIF